ncbi:CGNR zinc finger domain-containing protein [Streptomyces sp. NBC_00239]|uniref:CGNR zinc finger domain-containing protein n=1 Tax=Streptomyces sp. NBC_00239 TaxID=2903640 RepID=UPI002E2C0C90|nr:ABATE domain-containing protein [Streptomyces sp. NBC_00239]
MEFPLLGEPLALDLVNTRPLGVDLLATPESLDDWLRAQADRLPPLPTPGTGPRRDAGRGAGSGAEAASGAAELAAVHAVREAAAQALGAGRLGERPPAEALRVLNGALAGAPARRELRWDDAGPVAAELREGSRADRLAAVLAESVAELLLDPRLGQVRACEGADCVLLFLPAHPRRRWCVASACGNRARVARYYQRHKG